MFLLSLELMLYGLGGVFLSLGVLYACSRAMVRFFPAKPEENKK